MIEFFIELAAENMKIKSFHLAIGINMGLQSTPIKRFFFFFFFFFFDFLIYIFPAIEINMGLQSTPIKRFFFIFFLFSDFS